MNLNPNINLNLININKISVFLIILITFITSGCGFHLRGKFSMPKILQTLAITPDEPFEPLQKSLRRALTKNGIKLVSLEENHEINKDKNLDKKNAIVTLHLSETQFSEQILAYNNNGQPARVKLTLIVGFKLIQSKKEIRGLKNIQKSRDFAIAPDSLLSSDRERQLNKTELYQECINEILRQLSKYAD